MAAKWMVLVMAFALAGNLVALTPAEARRVWPTVGMSPGDASVTAVCPGGQTLVGLSGRSGAWIDQIQLMCATPMANGSFGPPAPGSDRLGGTGGGAQTAVCDRASRLLTVKIDLTADAKRVGSIKLTCVAADGRQTPLMFGQYSASSRAVAKCGKGVIQTGCDPGELDRMVPQQSCPQEQFVGATVRFGNDVNAIGFICDSVAATGRDSVAPARRIKHTGRPL